MPEKRPKTTFPRAAALQWLRGIAMELQRIARVARAAARDEAASVTVGDTAASGADRQGVPQADDEEEDAARGDVDDDLTYATKATAEALEKILIGIRRSLDEDTPVGNPTDDFVTRWQEVSNAVDAAIEALKQSGPGDEPCARDMDVDGTSRAAEAMSRIASTLAEGTHDVQRLREGLDVDTNKATAEADAEDARRWREWLDEDFKAGASRAHAFSRLPQQAVPVAAKLPGGAISAAPEALLEEQRAKYRTLWKPYPRPFNYNWHDVSELPVLTADQIRQAAKTFKERTAITFDGFHPRHLGDLSNGALEALASIFQAVEVCGRWPRQLRLVATALLPKPKGGFRPIGIMPAPYRLWAKSRRAWADKWEAEHARPFLSSAKGNGPIDTLWRMGVRQEAGTALDDQAAVIAEDLSAFFESVDRERLMIEAEALGYPPALLRGALAAYSSARMLTMHGRVAREIHPTTGVVAGCSLAMSLTKLFYLRALDGFVARLPATVTLDIHVDDITLSAIGPPSTVIRDITAARRDLATVMEGLSCRFAEDKTAITATTRRLASSVAAALGLTTAIASTPCILGVDNVAGARRSRLRAQSKKAARLRSALARRSRLDRLRRALGTKVQRIFRTGVLPAAAYDAPIWGVSDSEVARLRRLAAAVMSPRARGRSLAMTHLWHGMPTAEVEVAPALQYAKMIWTAATRKEDAAARNSSLTDLRRQWDAAQVKFGPLAQRALDERKADGTLPPKVARTIWGQVQGPIAAAAISLARIGWRFTSAFELEDPHGSTHTLTTTSPALLRDLLKHATRDAAERKVGASLAAQHPSFEGRRACLDLAITASRPGRKVNRQQSAAFRAVACGAVWTASVAQARGYATDGLCTLCKRARDTVRHRVYECDHTRDAVAASVPRWFWDEATRTGAHAPFWVTAIMPHPADTAPLPRADVHCQVQHHTDEARQAATDANRTDISGRVYIDGSAYPSVIRGMARAAGSIIMTNEEGHPVKTIQLPVPRGLPQTSQAAENLVLAVACSFARGPAQMIGDCMSVVRMFAAPAARALAPARKYAGLMLTTFADPARRRSIAVRWVKAHRSAESAESPEDAADIRGNTAADEAAKEAVEIHPRIDATTAADIEYYTKRAPHVVTAVTTAMALFPKAATGMARAPRPTTVDEARATQRHLWIFSAGTWRCAACDDYIVAPSIPRYRRYQRCTGIGFSDAAPNFARLGHTLVKTDGELPVTACTRCGAWGNRRTRKLGRPCGPPTREGEQVVKRLLRGLHPLWRKPGHGGGTAREQINIVAAFNGADGSWENLHPEHLSNAAAAAGAAGAAAADQYHTEDHSHEVIERDPALDGDHRDGDLHDMPPHDFADGDEDVFGHGGGLDDTSNQPEGGAPADIVTLSVYSPPAAIVDTPAEEDQPAQQNHTVPARRRRREEASKEPHDFAREAVERLGAGLSRRDANASERMRQLRRRVCARERDYKEDESHRPAPHLPTDGGGALPALHGREDDRELGPHGRPLRDRPDHGDGARAHKRHRLEEAPGSSSSAGLGLQECGGKGPVGAEPGRGPPGQPRVRKRYRRDGSVERANDGKGSADLSVLSGSDGGENIINPTSPRSSTRTRPAGSQRRSPRPRTRPRLDPAGASGAIERSDGRLPHLVAAGSGYPGCAEAATNWGGRQQHRQQPHASSTNQVFATRAQLLAALRCAAADGAATDGLGRMEDSSRRPGGRQQGQRLGDSESRPPQPPPEEHHLPQVIRRSSEPGCSLDTMARADVSTPSAMPSASGLDESEGDHDPRTGVGGHQHDAIAAPAAGEERPHLEHIEGLMPHSPADGDTATPWRQTSAAATTRAVPRALYSAAEQGNLTASDESPHPVLQFVPAGVGHCEAANATVCGEFGEPSNGATTNRGVYSAAAASIAAASDGGDSARATGASATARHLGAAHSRRRLNGKQTLPTATACPATWRGAEPPG